MATMTLLKGLLLLLLAAPKLQALRLDAPPQASPFVFEADKSDDCQGRPPRLSEAELSRYLSYYKIEGASGYTNAIVTYAGLEKQSYIDGAVMLGRSLHRLHLMTYRLAMVQRGMKLESMQLLRNAGWHVLEVDKFVPEDYPRWKCGYWRDSYNKADIFRLPFPQVVYLDADTYVFGNRSDFLPLMNAALGPGEIRMAWDADGQNFNSGVMVYRPSIQAFKSIFRMMQNATLDQPAINWYFRNEAGPITVLPARYNVHAKSKHDCNDVVIAHFTGLDKPALNDKQNLGLVKAGVLAGIGWNVDCPNLYQGYYKAMKNESKFLSSSLRQNITLLDG